MEDWPTSSEREGNGCVADCGLVQVKEFIVPSDDSVLEWVVVQPSPKIPGIAILAMDRGSSEVRLKYLGHDHG